MRGTRGSEVLQGVEPLHCVPSIVVVVDVVVVLLAQWINGQIITCENNSCT